MRTLLTAATATATAAAPTPAATTTLALDIGPAKTLSGRWRDWLLEGDGAVCVSGSFGSRTALAAIPIPVAAIPAAAATTLTATLALLTAVTLRSGLTRLAAFSRLAWCGRLLAAAAIG